jgi:hypothetical protein
MLPKTTIHRRCFVPSLIRGQDEPANSVSEA